MSDRSMYRIGVLVALAMALTGATEARAQEHAAEAKIARLGKVGFRHIYRVNGTVLGLSEGDSIGNCIVRPSGLDCGSGAQDLASEVEQHALACSKERDALAAEAQERRGEASRIKAELDTAKAETERLKTNDGGAKKLEAKIARLTSEVSEKEAEIDRLDGEIRKQKKDLAAERKKIKKIESSVERKDREIADLREAKCYNSPKPVVGTVSEEARSPYQKAWSDLVYVPCDSCRKEDVQKTGLVKNDTERPTGAFFDPSGEIGARGGGENVAPQNSRFDAPPSASQQADLGPGGLTDQGGQASLSPVAAQTREPNPRNAARVVAHTTGTPVAANPVPAQPERRIAVVHFRPDSGQVVVAGENSLFDAVGDIKTTAENSRKMRVIGVACWGQNGESLAKARADVVVKNLAKNGYAGATVATSTERCPTPKDSLAASRAELYLTARP